MFDYQQHVRLAADSIDRLRQCDVYRLMEWAPAPFRAGLANYLKQNRPDLAAEVDDCLADLVQS